MDKPDYVDMLIEHYNKTGDDTAVNYFAGKFENANKANFAIKLYDAVGDYESLERIITTKFIENEETVWLEAYGFEKYNINLTPELWEQRGDYKFEEGNSYLDTGCLEIAEHYYDLSLESYVNSMNQNKIEKTLDKILDLKN